MTCRICGNSRNNRVHLVPEMMFGLDEQFEYLQCARCGCLQLRQIPPDLGRYYPAGYYSFSATHTPRGFNLMRRFNAGRTRAFLRSSRPAGTASGAQTPEARFCGPAGRLLNSLCGTPALPAWLPKLGLNLDARILDVGCGAGHLLLELHRQGFRHLTGVDPYLLEDIHPAKGVRILKSNLGDLPGFYDLIMFHHSFEHIADPGAALDHVHAKLPPSGQALIRIPVFPSCAWHTYGTNWVQLDAPRHIYLHSIRSLQLLAGHAGLAIEKVEYDSSAFQFLGSELYRRGIPLTRAMTDRRALRDELFTPAEITAFRQQAAELNAAGQGDQACFYLKKPD